MILRHDRRGALRFAPLASDYGAALVARHSDLRSIDSMVWVEPATTDREEQVVTRSDAALRVARYLGGPWRLLLVLRLLPRVVRDRAYDWVARHRHRLMGKDQCFVPPPDVRARFTNF